jgi:hypothetical protein
VGNVFDMEEEFAWRLGRTSRRGGNDCRLNCLDGLGFKRSNPQSFVTSHQNEYNELTMAAKSLHASGEHRDNTTRASENYTCHRRNRGCSPCHISSATSSPFSRTNSETTIPCAAERKMTGKAVAYFIALARCRRPSFE